MTQRKKTSRLLRLEFLNPRIVLDGAGLVEPIFFGPVPYLSEADTPEGFLPEIECDECVYGLEDFEDDSLDFDIEIPEGEIIDPEFGTGFGLLTDSVDGDDGVIDGTGQTGEGGYSYFRLVTPSP